MRLKALMLLAAAILFAISPAFSTFDGFDPALYPVPQVDPPVQPAGYAFAIWGLIYLWLIAHAGFGLWRRAEDPLWDAPRWPLVVSLGVGVPWLAVAERSPLLATAMIWGMLVAALLALMRTSASADRAILMPPVAIYAGWLTAAASVSVGLVLAGWGLATETVAAWIGLAVALGLGAAVQKRIGRAPEYGATVIWALVAIMAKGPPATVLLLAGAGVIVMGALAVRAARAEAGRTPLPR